MKFFAFLVIVGIVFAFTTDIGANVAANTIDVLPLGSFKEKAQDFIFPKSEREILIDNISEEQTLLKRFFAETQPAILNNGTLSTAQKEEFKKAAEAAQNAAAQLEVLEQQTDNEQSLFESIAKKAIPAIKDSFSGDTPATTPLPANCSLQCTP